MTGHLLTYVRDPAVNPARKNFFYPSAAAPPIARTRPQVESGIPFGARVGVVEEQPIPMHVCCRSLSRAYAAVKVAAMTPARLAWREPVRAIPAGADRSGPALGHDHRARSRTSIAEE